MTFFQVLEAPRDQDHALEDYSTDYSIRTSTTKYAATQQDTTRAASSDMVIKLAHFLDNWTWRHGLRDAVWKPMRSKTDIHLVINLCIKPLY